VALRVHASHLSTKAVKSTAGALEGVDDVESGDSFAKQEIRNDERWMKRVLTVWHARCK